jgi:hypothetical protein
MSDRHIESLTGMKIGRSNTTLSPRFRLTKERHPALRYGDYDRVYGFIDRDIHSNVWLGSSLRPPYMNPAFHIDDPDAEVLGRYCESGLAAFALKAMDGYTSVYCAPQILRAELIASVASYSGCHIYTASGDCLYANKRYLCVHAAYTGEREITFPTETSPYEVYEKRYYGRNVNSLKLNMRVGETLMFQLDKR